MYRVFTKSGPHLQRSRTHCRKPECNRFTGQLTVQEGLITYVDDYSSVKIIYLKIKRTDVVPLK